MNKIFKGLTCGLLALSASWLTFADSSDKPHNKGDHKGANVEERINKRVEVMTKRLDLNTLQTAQVKEIFESTRLDRKNTRQELRVQGFSRQEIREQMEPERKAIRDEVHSKILAVLNSSQAEKFKEFSEKRISTARKRLQNSL